jgi:ornithine cyclodeaminase/alanine dehydrogenase-like protein (mu-crystallin family)
MDADWITAMRTGAVAASAINHFQNSNASEYSIIGLGNTARATLLCLVESNPGKTFKIKILAYKDQADLFISRFSSYSNIDFSIVYSNEGLIEGTDVIISCVTAANDIIGEDRWYKEGVLVIPVHTRGFQNCDLFFDKIFVDDIGHVKDFKYFNKFKSCEEFSKVLLEEVPGRSNDEERILAYNIGIALHDTYFASEIFRRLSGLSPDIDINDSNLSKFWV